MKYIDSNALGGTGVVAQKYTVGLHQRDFESLSAVIKPLRNELHQAIINHAKFEKYALQGDPLVSLVVDAAVSQGSCIVSSDLPQSTLSTTHEALELSFVVILPNGTNHNLTGESMTIGRQSSCAIVIEDTNVSRVHAIFRWSIDQWTIEDNGSTNGTHVNGTAIVEPTILVGGDEISLGAVHIRFERA